MIVPGKYLLLCAIISLFAIQVHAQIPAGNDVPVIFKVSNSREERVPFYTITVTNRLDEKSIQSKVADSTGESTFQLLLNNQYSVVISSVNFLPIEKKISVTKANQVFVFTAEAAGKTLDAAVITAQRP